MLVANRDLLPTTAKEWEEVYRRLADPSVGPVVVEPRTVVGLATEALDFQVVTNIWPAPADDQSDVSEAIPARKQGAEPAARRIDDMRYADYQRGIRNMRRPFEF